MELNDYKYILKEVDEFIQTFQSEEISIGHMNDKIKSLVEYCDAVHQCYKSVFTRNLSYDVKIASSFFERSYHMKVLTINILERVGWYLENKINFMEKELDKKLS